MVWHVAGQMNFAGIICKTVYVKVYVFLIADFCVLHYFEHVCIKQNHIESSYSLPAACYQ